MADTTTPGTASTATSPAARPARPAFRTAGRARPGATSQRDSKGYFRLFTWPALLLYTLGFLGPSMYGVVISFAKWSGPGAPLTWVGWRNYVRVFRDETVRQAFWNTAVIVLVGGAAVFALAFLAMAVLRDMRGRAFVRAALYLPSIISMIAVGTSLGFLLNPDGVVNRLLGMIGLESAQQTWLDPQHIFGCIVVGVVWMGSGFYIVLLMTAVDAIPKHLYEEAQLTGLTRMQQFRWITLPLSRDMIAIAAVLWTANSLRTFDIVIGFVGTAGTPSVNSRTYAVQQWLSAGHTTGGGAPELGYASAMATLLTVLTVALVVLVRRLGRSDRLEIS